jgi:hypothetical protein
LPPWPSRWLASHSATVLAFNVGADVTYFLTPMIGVGVTVRHVGGSFDFLRGGGREMDPSGFRFGFGARVRFRNGMEMSLRIGQNKGFQAHSHLTTLTSSIVADYNPPRLLSSTVDAFAGQKKKGTLELRHLRASPRLLSRGASRSGASCAPRSRYQLSHPPARNRDWRQSVRSHDVGVS